MAKGLISFFQAIRATIGRAKLTGEEIEAGARQALENLGEVPQAAGSSWDRAVKVNCSPVHAAWDFDRSSNVFKEFFPADPPARTTAGGALAVDGGLIEVALIATV
jgi:2-iminobutanoate/2-iminopropanoate deaminase